MSTYGLYIPQAVLSQAQLSHSALLVLGEILNLYKVSKHVWATDQHFTARIPSIKPRTVSAAIQELEREGFITRVTNQRAVHKRIITPTSLCYQAIAESAIAHPEEQGPKSEPIADSAIATPDLSQKLPEPTAESATDLPQNLPEPIADSASINDKGNKRGNKQPSSRKAASKGSTNLSSPEVKNPEEGEPKSGPTPELEPWAIWMAGNASRVQRLGEPITAAQWANLIEEYHEAVVKDVLCDMHNHAPLLRKYVSANRTARQWLRNRNAEKKPKAAAKPKPAPEPELNLEEVARSEDAAKAAAKELRQKIRSGQS